MNYNEENKYYTCKYDRPFKEIFLNEKNKDMLKDLLEVVLKVKINKIEVKPNERNTRNIKIRRKTYDALLDTNVGKIEIEVNAGIDKYLYPRNAAYICDLYSHHTQVSEEYSEDVMIMQINFTYGLGKKEKMMRTYKIRDEEGKEFVKNFQILEINMDYYINIWYDKSEKGKDNSLIEKNKLLIMLGLEKEELEKLSKNYKEVNEYMEKLNELNHSPEFIKYMTYEEDQRKIFNTKMREAEETGLANGIEKGIEEGIEKGIEKGISQEKIKIAKEMLKEKLPIEQISKITKLSIKEIEKLK